MSESQRICVCGKQGAKEPVVITITTCKNKNCKIESGICVPPTPNTAEAQDTTSSPPSVSAHLREESRESTITAGKSQNGALKTEETDKGSTHEPTNGVEGQGETKPEATEGINGEEDDMITALKTSEMKASTHESILEHDVHKTQNFEEQSVTETLKTQWESQAFQTPPPEEQPKEDAATAPENAVDAIRP